LFVESHFKHCFVLYMTVAAPVALPSQSLKEFEMIYNMVRTDGIFMLKHSDLELQHNLGKGNFGSVMRGTYRLRGKVIDVAVKVLKANDTAAEVRVVFFFSYYYESFYLFMNYVITDFVLSFVSSILAKRLMRRAFPKCPILCRVVCKP